MIERVWREFVNTILLSEIYIYLYTHTHQIIKFYPHTISMNFDYSQTSSSPKLPNILFTNITKNPFEKIKEDNISLYVNAKVRIARKTPLSFDNVT